MIVVSPCHPAIPPALTGRRLRRTVTVEVTIDQIQPPITIQRPQTDSTRHYARFFYLPEQAPGQHTAVLRVKQLPEGMSFYAGQILVIGTVRPEK
jgi:hypothetical protein